LEKVAIDELSAKHIVGILQDVLSHVEGLPMPELVPLILFGEY